MREPIDRDTIIQSVQNLMVELNNLHDEIYTIGIYPERRAYDEALVALITLHDLLKDNK